ncbi:hypothetical protein A9Q88_09565 [Gammaproteobacteria bacterium 50_400_T64]|nr:hypothetical protein A9Q88_09565 [Gammaproteobacteria bacterium 50_400_T64]
MKRLRMMLACVFAVVLIGVGSTGPVFADKLGGTEKAVAISVNINKANAEELAVALFNIGESKAEAIVKYRKEHGAFTSKEQLLNIKGIGESTLEKNKDLITL